MPKRLSIPAISAVLALGLSGCGLLNDINANSQAPSSVDASKQAGKPPPARTTETRKPSVKQQTAVATKNSKDQEGGKSPDATKEDAPRGEAGVPKLVGLNQTQVAEVLGPPMAETEKAPGKVWRYWNSRCSLEVSLYLDIQSRAYRVISYEVTNHDHSSGGRSACLAELPKSKLQPATYER